VGNQYTDRILTRAKLSPGQTFATLLLDGEWVRVSYGELVTNARRYAYLYRTSGLAPDDVVLLILRHSIDMYAAFLGTLLAGGVPSFLPYPNRKHDHSLYWTQHQKLFHRVRPRLIVAYDELAESVAGCARGSGATTIRDSDVKDVPAISDIVARSNDDAALLQHSSGTTGLKKGVALSYGAIVRQIESYASALSLDSTTAVIGSWLPLYHDMGLITSFLLPMYTGVPVISIDPFEWVGEPKLLLEAIETHHVTHIWLPNFAFLHLVRAVSPRARYRLGSIKALINCSEPCKPAVFDSFLRRYAGQGVTAENLQTCYAMAETVFAVTQSKPGQAPRRVPVDRFSIERIGPMAQEADTGNVVEFLSNGLPIEGCEIAILVGERLVGEGYLGEICVRGNFLFQGYYRNPEATAAAFHDGWYRSGDLGFVNARELFVAGRIKDVIIINGKNVFAHDIEASLAGVQGIKGGRAVAIGVYDEKMGSEQLVVIAESNETSRPEHAIIGEINRAVLLETGVSCAAVHIVSPGWLIKTTSGKVSRYDNHKKYLGTLTSAGP
jgi:acyl-CoA synthetase (AMP-forming)/AMP-acid ligase II